jgi:DNA-binding GntR family transcriptional regulator
MVNSDNRIRPQSLVDSATERLETAIMEGHLEPGTRLSEQALATEFGISRGPLREAIRRLEGQNLLERTPNIGVTVARLSDAELYDLLLVREALEGMACRLSAEAMTDREILELHGLLDEHESHQDVKTGAGYYQEPSDFDFHYRIAKGSHNERLFTMLSGGLYRLLRVYRYKSSRDTGRTADAFKEHRAIVTAIAKRDPDAAEKAMRDHLRHARDRLKERLSSTKEL